MEVHGEPRELTVVGAYQDITHGGLTAKAMLPTEGEEVTRYVLSARLEPGADVGAAMERLSSQLPEVKVVEIDTFLEQILGPLASAVTPGAAVRPVPQPHIDRERAGRRSGRPGGTGAGPGGAEPDDRGDARRHRPPLPGSQPHRPGGRPRAHRDRHPAPAVRGDRHRHRPDRSLHP